MKRAHDASAEAALKQKYAKLAKMKVRFLNVCGSCTVFLTCATLPYRLSRKPRRVALLAAAAALGASLKRRPTR